MGDIFWRAFDQIGGWGMIRAGFTYCAGAVFGAYIVASHLAESLLTQHLPAWGWVLTATAVATLFVWLFAQSHERHTRQQTARADAAEARLRVLEDRGAWADVQRVGRPVPPAANDDDPKATG